MKTYLLLIIALFVQTSGAAVLEVNSPEGKVYYHPTPTLEANLMSLADGSGYLMISLDYIGKDTEAELASLHQQYENYQIQPLTAEHSEASVVLNISEIGLQKEIQLRNGQMGPYINVQIELKKDQVDKLKKLKDQIQKSFNFEIQARSSFNSDTLIESYQAGPDVCDQLKVQSVGDLIKNISLLKKPDGIKYSQTFDSLKATLLNSCFEVKPQSIESFAELMKLPVGTVTPNKALTGRFVQKKSQDKVFGIKPNLKILLN